MPEFSEVKNRRKNTKNVQKEKREVDHERVHRRDVSFNLIAAFA